MSVGSFIGQAFADLKAGGASFALANFRQRWGSGTVPFTLCGHRLTVRARNSDYQTFRQVYRDRQYAVTTPAFAARIDAMLGKIRASGRVPVIVDAGANVGAASLWLAQAYPGCVVVAIEPDPENVALLRANTAGVPEIRVVEAAVGARAGHAAVVAGSEGGWATQTRRATSGVPIVTMRDAVELVPDGELFLAKVDIEGFESDLFSEATEWLDQACAVFIEPHDWMLPDLRTSRTFQRAFADRDFDLLLVGENIVYVRGEAEPA